MRENDLKSDGNVLEKACSCSVSTGINDYFVVNGPGRDTPAVPRGKNLVMTTPYTIFYSVQRCRFSLFWGERGLLQNEFSTENVSYS